jgi:hypothetical protein
MGSGFFKKQQSAQASKNARALSALAARVNTSATVRPVDAAVISSPRKSGVVLPRR